MESELVSPPLHITKRMTLPRSDRDLDEVFPDITVTRSKIGEIKYLGEMIANYLLMDSISRSSSLKAT